MTIVAEPRRNFYTSVAGKVNQIIDEATAEDRSAFVSATVTETNRNTRYHLTVGLTSREFIRPHQKVRLSSSHRSLSVAIEDSNAKQIGEQHSSVPTHTPEPEKTPHVGLEHDLGGPSIGLGL
jgi:hypothetical protein